MSNTSVASKSSGGGGGGSKWSSGEHGTSPMSHSYGNVDNQGGNTSCSGGSNSGSSSLAMNLHGFRTSQHITQISHSVNNPQFSNYAWQHK